MMTDYTQEQVDIMNRDRINEEVINFCKAGNMVNLIKFFSDEENLKDSSNVSWLLEECLDQACSYNNLDIVKYLLTSDLSKKEINKDNGFVYACVYGHLKVVKYLLTSPELKEHAKIHTQEDLGFIQACSNGHLNIVKYLLTSPDLKDKVDIHADNDNGFIYATTNNYLDVISYLIFDIDIEKTKDIEKYLSLEKVECVENMFKIRDLNKQLSNDISSNKINHKKVKV